MTDLRAVERADVYLGDDLVGKLARDAHDAVTFDYLTDTIDHGRDRSVSWSLLYPASKYRIKTEDAITALASACAAGGGSAIVATLELLRTVVFSWLVGNGDLHGKNLSINNPDGLWQPTPAYDLLSTQPYTGWRDPMALNLFGRGNRLRRADFLSAAQRLGVRERAAATMIDSLCEAAEDWPDRCGEIGFTDRQTTLLAKMLRTRVGGLR